MKKIFFYIYNFVFVNLVSFIMYDDGVVFVQNWKQCNTDDADIGTCQI